LGENNNKNAEDSEMPIFDNEDSGTIISQEYRIDIKNFAYSLESLTIKKGDSVIWTNRDSIEHTVTSDSGTELNSALLSQEQEYSHTFTNSGTYNYHCTPHPYMKASIIVE
jgi:amicyanin